MVFLSLILILAVSVTVLYRLGKQSENQYRAAIEVLRAAGEPVTVADVCAAGMVAEADNAVPLLRKAAALVPSTFPDDLWEKVKDQPFVVPLTVEEKEYAAKVLGPMDEVRLHLYEADRRTGSHWGLGFSGLMINADLPDLNAQRALAMSVDHSILLATDRGDFVQAFDDLRLLFIIERRFHTFPVITGYLVGSGIEALAIARLEDVSARMTVGTESGQVSPDKVRAMMALLERETGEKAALKLAMQGDRSQFLQAAEIIAQGRSPDGEELGAMSTAVMFVRRASLWAGCRDSLRPYGQISAAIDAPDWPTCSALLPLTTQAKGDGDLILKLLDLLLPSLVRVCRFPYENDARRQVARVALAAHLYRSENEGRWPENLEQLVPRCLPMIPVDVMSAGGKIRLRGGSAPVIYSIGLDGVDGNGTPEAVRGGGFVPGSGLSPSHRSGDIVFRLTPPPRPLPFSADDAEERIDAPTQSPGETP